MPQTIFIKVVRNDQNEDTGEDGQSDGEYEEGGKTSPLDLPHCVAEVDRGLFQLSAKRHIVVRGGAA